MTGKSPSSSGPRVAVIPARGGSKRIPGKNIARLAGRPMIAWTIEAAIRAEIFDRVLVSTDDAEIAGIAREWGAEVPFLREAATDDFAPVSVATLAALDQLGEHDGTRPATVVQLMPNCPGRGAAEIRTGLARFEASDNGFLISCCRFGWMNPWWAMTLDALGRPEPAFPDALTKRSQDLPDLHCPTGAIWIADVAALRRAGSFYGPGHVFFPIPWRAAIDIDDADDLEFAEAVLSSQLRKTQAKGRR